MRGIAVSLMLVGASVVVTACQSDPDIDITKLGVETDPPDVLYKQALANMNKGNMTEASRKFEAIDKQYPFTEWGQKALVMQTFIATRTNKNDVAITTGSRFLRQYPRSKDAAYVQYMIGLAYSKQISDEMQVGRYYLERKEYLAAVSRFRIVVEQYQNTNQIEEALARLTEAYYAMGLVDEAQTAAAVLGNNYPDSQWYADSYKLLKGQGLEPRENKGSWISRAGKKLIGA